MKTITISDKSAMLILRFINYYIDGHKNMSESLKRDIGVLYKKVYNAQCLTFTPDKYQEMASRTIDPAKRNMKMAMLEEAAMGLSGEAGECIELVKKHICHRTELDINDLKHELGDVCWYVALYCTALNLSLEDVMQTNIEKILQRYPNGFTTEDSVKRVDIKGE